MALRSETQVLDGHVEWIVWPEDHSMGAKHWGLLELARQPTLTQVYMLDVADPAESEWYYSVPKNWEIV